MIINADYFIGDNNVPNTDYDDVSSSLEYLINVHEKYYLNAVLGEPLARLLIAAMEAEPVAAPYEKILNGTLYTSINGQEYQWEGLRNTSTFLSPIADYVYYWWLRNGVTQSSGIGEVVNGSMMASPASSKGKQAEAWNRMVDKSLYLFDYLRANRALFPTFSYFTYGYKQHQKQMLTRTNKHGI